MPSAVDRLLRTATSALAPIAHRSGKVLYSSVETLRPSPIYLLGLNPGGNPADAHDTHFTIAESLQRLPGKHDNDFLDERWDTHGAPGCSLLQKRVRWLLEQLNQKVEDVCASNLIFVRSQNDSGAGYPSMADVCWPVHVCVLDIVQPSLVLAYHARVFEYFSQRLEHGPMETIRSGHGDWVCRRAPFQSASSSFMVVQVPHLSRFKIVGKDHIVNWTREIL